MVLLQLGTLSPWPGRMEQAVWSSFAFPHLLFYSHLCKSIPYKDVNTNLTSMSRVLLIWIRLRAARMHSVTNIIKSTEGDAVNQNSKIYLLFGNLSWLSQCVTVFIRFTHERQISRNTCSGHATHYMILNNSGNPFLLPVILLGSKEGTWEKMI